MRLVFGHDAAVAEWVVRRIPYANAFKDFVAIGVADGNRPIAGFVYDEYRPSYGTMQISAAASTPRWAQKGVIRALLSYPFDQQGVNKLWTACASSNERALKLVQGVGFTKEGVLARHFGKDHAIICRMFAKDFRKRYGNGKVIPETAASA